jgi:hypothetical protein
VYYASDYVEYKSMIHLLKIERKKSLLDSIQRGEKAKAKGCYKARKARQLPEDSLLNRKGAYSEEEAVILKTK